MKSATRGPSLFSDWNTKITLRVPKSVPMGWYLTELVLKGIHRLHAANFEISHQGAKFILWLKCKWADIWLSWSWRAMCRVYAFWNQLPGAMFNLVTETQKWHLMHPNPSEWADILLSWSWKQSPFNWFCNQPQADWVIKWLKLALIGLKSVQVGCNLLILKWFWRVLEECTKLFL